MAGVFSAAQAADPAPAAATGTAVASAASPVVRLPVASFFRPDDIGAVELSPSGRLLAVTVLAADQRYALAVIDLDAGASTVVAYFSGLDIESFDWVNDERLVFSLYDSQRGSGDQQVWGGLFSVKRDGSDLRELVKLNAQLVSNSRPKPGDRSLDYFHTLLHVPAGGGDEVIVGEYRWDTVGDLVSIAPKRLNVVTGRAVSIAQGAPAYAREWRFDTLGTPRVAMASHEGRFKVYWRTEVPGSEQGAWKELLDQPELEASWWPYGIDAAGQFYVTTAEGPAGERVLRRFDFATGQPAQQALLATPGFDFTGRLVAETTGGRLLGLRIHTDAEQTVWFDPTLKALQAEIDRRLPGRVNTLHCRRCATPEATVLVFSHADRDPGQYWIWRGPVEAPTVWRSVGARRKGLNPRTMATVDFHRFAARDGLPIPVYVTLPAGTPAGQKLPAVVLVHGGPGVRGGYWRWDAQTQFLASRGYAVIAPEFRGSTGFGQKHYRAGWKQWGQAMQDDVADAVAWATRQGLIDPARVCIAGASYGGYATLMGLVRHPDLYRCGAAWVAATEPSLLFTSSWVSDISADGRRYYLPVTLGDPVADADMLRRYSPVQQAARIQAPVLMAFGFDDRRVPLEHGTRMRAAMRAAGKEPEYVVYEGEGHGWLRLDTQIDFAQRLEAFLARNLR